MLYLDNNIDINGIKEFSTCLKFISNLKELNLESKHIILL